MELNQFVNLGTDWNLCKSLDRTGLVLVREQVRGKNGVHIRGVWKRPEDVKETDNVTTVEKLTAEIETRKKRVHELSIFKNKMSNGTITQEDLDEINKKFPKLYPQAKEVFDTVEKNRLTISDYKKYLSIQGSVSKRKILNNSLPKTTSYPEDRAFLVGGKVYVLDIDQYIVYDSKADYFDHQKPSGHISIDDMYDRVVNLHMDEVDKKAFDRWSDPEYNKKIYERNKERWQKELEQRKRVKEEREQRMKSKQEENNHGTK